MHKLKKYTLYIDENYKKAHNNNAYTTIAGLAIENSKFNFLNGKVNDLKQKYFSTTTDPESIILHEVEITKVQFGRILHNRTYKPFARSRVWKDFYTDLNDIFSQSNGKIFGVTLKCSTISNWYPKQEALIREYLYCLPIIMENFLHFLKSEGATGEIVIESFNNDNDVFLVKQKYYNILANGTMFFDSKDYISAFEGIKVIAKSDNNNILQLVDFIPSRFNKNAIERIENCKVENNPTYLYQALKKLRYDGGNNQANRFGIKIIPKNL